MRLTAKLLVVAAGLAALSGPHAQAGPLKLGQPAPDFKGLVGTDDKKHGLSEFGDAKLVVVVFTCNHCPVAKGYEDRLIAMQKEFKPKGVQLVAVNVNNVPEDKLEAMKKRAEEKGFNFPYLYDPTQKIGRDYGATVTPHVFLLDGKRKVVYMGAVDDSLPVKKVKSHHLKDAINAMFDGKAPPKEVTQQFGCTIKYE